MDILGLSAFSSGAAAALIRDGQVIAAAEEERFSRIKHDDAFPKRALRYCLREGGITAKDLDQVVYFEKPLRKFSRVLASHLQGFPASAGSFARSMFLWLGDRLWMKNRIVSELGCDFDKVLFVEHQRAQAAAAFYASGFEDAALLSVGSPGEWASAALARGLGGQVEVLGELHLPSCLGLLSAAIAAYLGFEVGDGPAKLSQLAAFGKPRFAEAFDQLVIPRDDGAFTIADGVFRSIYDPQDRFGPALIEALGPARSPGAPLLYKGEDTRHADVAASLQACLEARVLALVGELRKRLETPRLCLAGGLVHNARLNAAVLERGPFDELFVLPVGGAAAGALGAALYAAHAIEGAATPEALRRLDFGEPALEDPKPEARTIETSAAEELAPRLAAGELCAWVRGRFELGPRALGRRVILARPQAEAGARLSENVTRHEAFLTLPVAVTAERAAEFFEIPAGADGPLRFQSLALTPTEAGKSAAPGAIHHDGRAEVQLVHKDDDPELHALLEKVGEQTEAPLLLLAPLCQRGDPPVRGEAQARELFERSEIDAVLVENRLYERKPAEA